MNGNGDGPRSSYVPSSVECVLLIGLDWIAHQSAKETMGPLSGQLLTSKMYAWPFIQDWEVGVALRVIRLGWQRYSVWQIVTSDMTCGLLQWLLQRVH